MSQFTEGGRIFKSQLDAVAFLKERGFRVSKSPFNRDLKAGKISTNANGHFEENSLLAYALAMKEPLAAVEQKTLTNATTTRLEADAELKKYQAERQKLRLEKERGELMPIADHEEALGARAQFFSSEIKSFITRKAAEVIDTVEGNPVHLQKLKLWWAEATEEWMDAWASDREFTLPDEEMVPDESEVDE